MAVWEFDNMRVWGLLEWENDSIAVWEFDDMGVWDY